MRYSSVCPFSRASDVLYLQTLQHEKMLIFRNITASQSLHVKLGLHISELVQVFQHCTNCVYGFSITCTTQIRKLQLRQRETVRKKYFLSVVWIYTDT